MGRKNKKGNRSKPFIDSPDTGISDPLQEFTSEETSAEGDLAIAKKALGDSEVYKIILDLRKFEIENFGKRTLFFWGTIGILLVGYFSAKNEQFQYLIFLSYLGFFYNLIFSISLRGSKYWAEHWEFLSVEHADKVQSEMFKRQIMKDIRNYYKEKKTFFLLRAERFSVSKLTMILSDITILLWIGLSLKDLSFLMKQNYLFFHVNFSGSFHPFTLYVIVFPIICFSYILWFFFGEIKRNTKTIQSAL